MSTEVVVGIVAIATLVVVALSVVFLCLLILNLTGRSRINVDIAGWGGAFIAAALAAALSVGLYGYSFKTSDYQAAQLPLIERLADPEAYPHDAFVDTAAEFPSGIARIAAHSLRRGRPLERVARDFHLAALFLTCFAFFFLAQSLFTDLRGSFLALALFVVSFPLHIASPLAYEIMGKDHFDVTEGAWPFALFALAFWGLGHTAVASAAAGALVWLHPLIGVLLLAALAASAAAEGLLDRRQPLIIHLTPALLPGLVVSLPFWMLQANPKLFSGGALLSGTLRAWYPPAFFAGAWSGPHWLYAAGILALSGYSVWRTRSYEEYHYRLPSLLIGLPALWLTAFLAGDLLHFRPVLLAQFFRTDVLLVIVALSAAGHQIRKYFSSSRAQTWCLGALLLLAWAGRPLWAYLMLATAAWVFWEWANEREFESYGPWLRRGAYGSASLLAGWGLASLFASGASWALEPDRSLGTLAAVLLAGLGAWRAALFPGWARRAATVVLLLLAFLPALRVVAFRVRAGTLASESDRDKDVRDLAASLSELAGPSDRLLTPPGEKFRALLGRPVVFEWNDAMAAQWAPGFDALWLDRLKDFHIDPAAMGPFWKERDRAIAGAATPSGASPLEAAFRALSARDLAALAEKHGATYVVAYADQPLSSRYFTPVASSKYFKAYQYLLDYK